MAEKLLFGTAQGITQTLGPLATKEIELLWGVKDEIERLRNTVSTIEDVLLDAEEKHAAGDCAVTRWLGRLEDAMFDADDLLDAVSTEALRRQIMTREMKAKQVHIFFSKSNQLVYRIKMAHKIKAIRERLDAIADDRQKFNLAVRHVEETRVGGKWDITHSVVCAEAIIGRDEDKNAVIDRLLDSNVEEKVTIHPIVGIGGLGKTTLAQLIFNDDRIQNHFQLKMWVCVSDSFDVQKIFAAATETKLEGVDQMDSLARKLKEKINGKKYLLVLDDVWNEDHEKWLRLKVVLVGGGEGSRIVVTTRAEKVASTIRWEKVPRIIKTVESYPLRGLDDGESWFLFKQMAFENGQEPKNSSIVKLGKEILQKCSGVPLAIRTIGKLLRSKNPDTEWLSFKDNEFSKISDQNETGILPTLKLSYDHLPSHLKHCFAYCCLFPKDCWIESSKLIQLWIAQGFVKLSDQKQCLEDVGNDYFKDLLWRSFFQEAETDEFGTVLGCKMHDLMHDLAISVAGSMITTLDAKKTNVDEKTRHVSVVCSDIDALSITTSLCKASSIRTLLCHSTPDHFWGESDCEAIFSSSKFLRVLVPGRKLDFLPSSIGKLKHLRYLDLSWNDNLKKLPNSITRLQNLQTLKLSFCRKLKKLPNSITRLQNLQTLKLSFCRKLEELPRDIKKLVNLRHLEIGGCNGLTYMPRGLGQLTNLLTLSNFVVDKDPLSRYSSGLRELNGLNNLRGQLCIQNLRHGKDDVASECEAANLKVKQHLHDLELRWSTEGGVNDSDVNVYDEVLLEVLQPHPNLKQLRLEGNFCSRLPSWLLSLTNLVQFELIECTKCQYLPSSIWKLQNLQTLRLTGCKNLEELPRDIKKLVNLRHLEIDHCDGLTYMPRGLGQLTNLQTLSNFVVDKDPLSRYSSGLRELNGLYNLRGKLCIQNLRHVKDVASEGKAANLKDKQHLHALDLQWSIEGGGNDSDINVDDEELLKVLQPHPNLNRLRLEGNFCSRLPSWLLSLTNLVSFELIACRKCRYLPPLSQLPSLKYLSLSSLDDLEYISDSNEFSSSSSASVLFFPSLNQISFNDCPNLKGWWRRTDSSVEVNSDTNNSVEITEHPLLTPFPCLSKLEICDCPMLTSMPMFPHLEEELELYNASWKVVQQTMMMNMAAPPSPTSTATASSSATPLSNLKSIILDSVADLETLPEESIIRKCNRLNSLSSGIQPLTALQNLDLSNCPELELANDEVGMQWQVLKSLLSLKFKSLPKLVSLPLGLQHATTLQRLEISNCENLTAIPEWIHNCTSLQVLEIEECSSLTSLPEGMRSLTSLLKLKIKNCPILLQRCEREAGEDWPKIAHIRELELQQPPQQRENSDTHASSTHPDAEVAESAKAQKKQRIWSIFKKSGAPNS